MKKLVSLVLSLLLVASLASTALASESASLSNFKQVNTYESGQFGDVKSSDWFESSVKVAYELGLVKGSSGTTFTPAGSVTIAESLALASRLYSIYHTGSAEFTQGEPWYQVYVDYAIANGIIADGQFADYSSAATRAQFAQILANSLDSNALVAINNIELIPDVSSSESYSNAVYQLYKAGILTGSDAKGTFNPSSNIQRSEVAAIVTRMANTSARKTITLNQCTANGHSWTPATCTAPKTCSVCGATEGVALGHNWSAATCTTPKTCSVCGQTEGSANGHNYQNGVCAVCGAEKIGTITCQTLPAKVNYWWPSSEICTSATITDYSYEYIKKYGEVRLELSLSGKKTYDRKGDFNNELVAFLVVLYDGNNNIVGSHEYIVSDVIVNQTFTKSWDFFGLDKANDYHIVIKDCK